MSGTELKIIIQNKWYLFANSQEGDQSLIPPVISLSTEHVNDGGIYLLENGDDCLIYIGNSVDSDILRQLFCISSVDEIPAQVIIIFFSP